MRDLISQLPIEDLIIYIDSKVPVDEPWVFGRGTSDLHPRRWYVGIDFDEMRGTDHCEIPPDPGWTVWVEGDDLHAVLAEAIVRAEGEVWG